MRNVNKKMKKTRKIKGLVLRAFIVIAVLRKNAFCIFPKMLGKCGSTFRRIVMMLISVVQGEKKFYMHKIHSIQKGEYYEYSVS